MGKDTKRYGKIGKDTKRWGKMGIDGGLIGERGFSCDVTSARVLLNCRFHYLGGGVVARVKVVFGFRLFLCGFSERGAFPPTLL